MTVIGCLLFVSWQEIQHYLNAGRQHLNALHASHGLDINPEGLTFKENVLRLNKGTISLDHLGSFSFNKMISSDGVVDVDQGQLFLTQPFLSPWPNKMFGKSAALNMKIKMLTVNGPDDAKSFENVVCESIDGRGVVARFKGFSFYQWGESSFVKGYQENDLLLKIPESRFVQIAVDEKKGYAFYQKNGTVSLLIGEVRTLFFSSKDTLSLDYHVLEDGGSGLSKSDDLTLMVANLKKGLKMELFFKTNLFAAAGTIQEGHEEWLLQTESPMTWSALFSSLTESFKGQFVEMPKAVDAALVSVAKITWTKGVGLQCQDLIGGATIALAELKAVVK